MTFVAPAALFATDETIEGKGGINDRLSAEKAYQLLQKIWHPVKKRFVGGYKGWEPLGNPLKGGSGVIINSNAWHAIHTLNRLCPVYDRSFYGIAKARPNAIWAFYGHSNSHDLGFAGDSSITNRAAAISCREQNYCVYIFGHKSSQISIPCWMWNTWWLG